MARESNLVDLWLRVTRLEDGGTMAVVSSSLRGSGDDMMSALGVAWFAMECQRRLNDSVATEGGMDSRCLDIGDNHRHGQRNGAWNIGVFSFGLLVFMRRREKG